MAAKRPISITLLSWLYIAVGAISTVSHAKEFLTRHDSNPGDFALICLVGMAAVVAGVFMLRAQNWARWLALAWMAFHVAIGATGPLREIVVHSLFLVLFAYLLFRPEARVYFRSRETA